MLKIGVAQFGVDRDTSPEEALEICVERAREAGSQGADLVVLPEMATGPFYPAYGSSPEELPETVEPMPGPAVNRMRDVASEHEMAVVMGALEEEEGRYYSSAAVLDRSGELAGVYRRIHRNSADEVDESWLSLGDGIPVFPTEFGSLGVMVGHDVHFPEESRILGLRGADILCVPSAAYGAHEETWVLELRAHTVAHGVFLAAANRSGSNGNLDFIGGSTVIDPRAKVLTRQEEPVGTETVECDLEEIREVRNVWQFFRDRRPETYEEMLENAPS